MERGRYGDRSAMAIYLSNEFSLRWSSYKAELANKWIDLSKEVRLAPLSSITLVYLLSYQLTFVLYTIQGSISNPQITSEVNYILATHFSKRFV